MICDWCNSKTFVLCCILVNGEPYYLCESCDKKARKLGYKGWEKDTKVIEW